MLKPTHVGYLNYIRCQVNLNYKRYIYSTSRLMFTILYQYYSIIYNQSRGWVSALFPSTALFFWWINRFSSCQVQKASCSSMMMYCSVFVLTVLLYSVSIWRVRLSKISTAVVDSKKKLNDFNLFGKILFLKFEQQLALRLADTRPAESRRHCQRDLYTVQRTTTTILSDYVTSNVTC